MKLSYDDGKHAYWLDGKRCKSISTVAKIPDDTFGLEQWRKRQILIGVAVLPELAERAAAHFDDRDQLDRMAEEALAAAKSHQAAARGTAAHRITERMDLGEQIIDTPQARAVQAAWTKALDVAGLEVVPELVERIVVWPDYKVAGRFDRVMRRKGDGKHVIVDLKTGSSAVKYPHALAVQLALYANAPLMAGPLSRAGGSTELFEPLPDLDTTVGYVIHMPSDDEVDVLGVDIQAGMLAARICFDTLAWRKQQDILIPVTEIPVESEQEATADREAWVLGRIRGLGNNPTARQQTASAWPSGVPTRPPWTDNQLDQIDRVLAAVEADTQTPFPPPDPSKTPTKTRKAHTS